MSSVVKNYVCGIVPGRSNKLSWIVDVDILYAPMHWEDDHWVALAIDLNVSSVTVLDPCIGASDEKKLGKLMKPILEMLPSVMVSHGLTCNQPQAPFIVERPLHVSQSSYPSDFGPLSIKYVELHAQGFSLDGITGNGGRDAHEIRSRLFEEFVHSISS